MRRKVREKALQVLYQWDMRDIPMQEIFRLDPPPSDWKEDDREFFLCLTRGVEKQLQCIDRSIMELTPGWPLHRMATVDRNILRIAVHEILNVPDISVKIAINEAVVLAKKFSTEESGKFINGVLGKLAKNIASSNKK